MTAADKIWVSTIAGLLAADLVLYKTDRALLTDQAREHKLFALTLLGVFALHILDVLGPVDPFRRLAGLIR